MIPGSKDRGGSETWKGRQPINNALPNKLPQGAARISSHWGIWETVQNMSARVIPHKMAVIFINTTGSWDIYTATPVSHWLRAGPGGC